MLIYRVGGRVMLTFFGRSQSRKNANSNTLNLNYAKTKKVIVLIFSGVLDLPMAGILRV